MLSIIIPTLNESLRLPRLLGDLEALSVAREIIVSDGGSSDGTPAIAAAKGCTAIRGPRGRGTQLAAGVDAARGDWLLILHADARLTPAALRELELALARSDVQFAAWPLAIDAPGMWMRLVEIGAALRWRLAGLAYGDQGLLVRKPLYHASGGYPDVPIMEDVVLIRKLSRLATAHRFRHPIVADSRRYTREGRVVGSLRNLSLLLLFMAGASPQRLARWYLPEPAP